VALEGQKRGKLMLLPSLVILRKQANIVAFFGRLTQKTKRVVAFFSDITQQSKKHRQAFSNQYSEIVVVKWVQKMKESCPFGHLKNLRDLYG
jgi:hypothetical protein